MTDWTVQNDPSTSYAQATDIASGFTAGGQVIGLLLSLTYSIDDPSAASWSDQSGPSTNWTTVTDTTTNWT